MKRTSETIYLQSMVQDAYHKAETIKEKVKIQKKNKLIPGTNYNCTVGARIPNKFGIWMVHSRSV